MAKNNFNLFGTTEPLSGTGFFTEQNVIGLAATGDTSGAVIDIVSGTNNPDAAGLHKAASSGVQTHVVDQKQFQDQGDLRDRSRVKTRWSLYRCRTELDQSEHSLVSRSSAI